MQLFISFFAGLLFGLGLLISGMSNPEKVLSFLDITGTWDPSLVLVMGGAIGIALIPFRIAAKSSVTLLGDPIVPPNKQTIDAKLILGSALFGIGWGLAGICPGPAITLIGAGITDGFIFVLAMLAGMWIWIRLPQEHNP